MKKILIVLMLCFTVPVFSQLSNLLNKDSSQVLPLAIDEQTDLDAAFFNSLKQRLVELTSALENRDFNDQDYASLSTVVTAAAADTAHVKITGRHSISSNYTISGQCDVEMVPGGFIYPSSITDTLFIDVPFKAEYRQVFADSLVVIFKGAIKEVTPHWWANIDSSTSGVTVATALKRAIESGVRNIFMPGGVYKLNSVIIDKNVNIYGASDAKQFYRIADNLGYTINEFVANVGDGATIINMQSTAVDSPVFNIRAGAVDGLIQAGLKISNLLFYQVHSDYTAPTSYPWVISDTLSTRFWDGITLENLGFMGVYKGIQLSHAERVDMVDIYGDFFYEGIYGNTWNDVSKFERIHIWPFAWSSEADTWKKSASSSWAIYLDNVDGLIMNDVFMIGREKGIYLKEIWGSIRDLTFDTVGRPLEIYNPRSLGTDFNGLDILQGSEVAEADAVVKITGDENTTANYIHMTDVEFFQSGTYAAKDGIYIDYDSLQISLNKIVMKGGMSQSGLHINDVLDLSASDFLFTGFNSGQAVGDDSLARVSIRNNAANAKIIKFSDIRYGPGPGRNHVFKYMYDGYFDNVVFDYGESLIEIDPVYATHASGGTFNSTYTDSIKIIEYTHDNNAAPFQGVRFIGGINGSFEKDKWYTFGAVYKVTTLLDISGSGDPDNYRCIGLPTPNKLEELTLVVDPNVDTARRLTIMSVLADTSGPPTYDNYGKTFDGVLEIYEQFINKDGNLLTYPKRDKENWRISAAPTTDGGIWNVNDFYFNSAPGVGENMGWVNVTKGSPGTWAEFGIIDLEGSDTWDPGSIVNGAEEVKEVTVTGAALGDYVVVSFSLDVADLAIIGSVTTTNTVTVSLINNTGGAIDLASGTVYAKVIKR